MVQYVLEQQHCDNGLIPCVLCGETKPIRLVLSCQQIATGVNFKLLKIFYNTGKFRGGARRL